jgi:hypothetical protein
VVTNPPQAIEPSSGQDQIETVAGEDEREGCTDAGRGTGNQGSTPDSFRWRHARQYSVTTGLAGARAGRGQPKKNVD